MKHFSNWIFQQANTFTKLEINKPQQVLKTLLRLLLKLNKRLFNDKYGKLEIQKTKRAEESQIYQLKLKYFVKSSKHRKLLSYFYKQLPGGFFKKGVLENEKLLKSDPVQVFSCEFCEIFKSTYFGKHVRMAFSVFWWSIMLIMYCSERCGLCNTFVTFVRFLKVS